MFEPPDGTHSVHMLTTPIQNFHQIKLIPNHPVSKKHFQIHYF